MADSVAEFFDSLESRIDSSKTAGMNAIFQFHISGDNGGDWQVKLLNGVPSVVPGVAEDPSIVISASDADWLSIVNGSLSGQAAFLTGRLKVQGDMSLAMKLQSLLG